MTDIIERLETFGDAHSWAVRGDAADEVRRLRAQRDQLLAALKAVVADIHEYERINNLAPNPGRSECWDSVAHALVAIAAVEDKP